MFHDVSSGIMSGQESIEIYRVYTVLEASKKHVRRSLKRFGTAKPTGIAFLRNGGKWQLGYILKFNKIWLPRGLESDDYPFAYLKDDRPKLASQILEVKSSQSFQWTAQLLAKSLKLVVSSWSTPSTSQLQCVIRFEKKAFHQSVYPDSANCLPVRCILITVVRG